MPVPDFSPGEVLTAAAMDSIGLWLVKTEIISGTPSSVVVSNAFPSDYENFKVILSGGSLSAVNNIQMALGASTTGYNDGVLYNSTTALNTPAAAGTANTAAFWSRVGGGGTAGIHFDIDVLAPNLAKTTSFSGVYIFPGTPIFFGHAYGFHNVATAYTGFTLSVPGGVTFTGGTIRVYGYRK